MLNLNLDPPLNIPGVTAPVPVNKKQPAIYCENCNLWFHKKYLKKNSAVFEAIANSSESWICCNCDLPNFSSSLSLSFSSFDLLQNLPEQDNSDPSPNRSY